MGVVLRVIGFLLAALDGERERKADEGRQLSLTTQAKADDELATVRLRLLSHGFKDAAERLKR